MLLYAQRRPKGNEVGLKYIAVRPDLYNRLIELGSMRDSFNDVLSEIMKKAEVAGIIPEYKEYSDKE
jgi:predicted CopG family antitoxin